MIQPQFLAVAPLAAKAKTKTKTSLFALDPALGVLEPQGPVAAGNA